MTKRVLITGAASGLGWELTKQYQARGWHVILLDRDGDALAGCSEQMSGSHETCYADLTDGVQVFIGSEAALDDVDDISVISSPYRRDGARVGSFGIVGPTRMDYKKYVHLVGFAADVLSDVLDGRLPGSTKGS